MLALLAEFQADPILTAAQGEGQRPTGEVGERRRAMICRACPSCGVGFEQPADLARKPVY